MPVVNLSFSACGFLGIYQLGAVGAILRHGARLQERLQACAGASAGSLVAALMVTAPHKLEPCKQFAYRFANEVRRQRFGAVTPGYDFMLRLREGLEEILPTDAHSLATDRLHVSLTHSGSHKNAIVSRFASRDELIRALLASSYVPIYAGFQPVEFQRQTWFDGGFTDSLPLLPAGRTVTVSPFSGPQDVCPVHRGLTNLHLRLPNMNVMFSKDNLVRLKQALFPPPAAYLRSLCEEGFDDAMRFLKREKWMD